MAKAAKTVTGKIDNVKIRMYCMGTGDCFILKFCDGTAEKFTMMIDCGSCQGTPTEFAPYINDLAKYVKQHVNLLIVTHEHQDHVNGFAKCEKVFKDAAFKIDEAWFAWTENPEDPDGKAKELMTKREKMKKALDNAITAFQSKASQFSKTDSDDYFKPAIEKSNAAFIDGLETLSQINLVAAGEGGKSLPGMVKIKAILKQKKTKVRYLNPGDTVKLPLLPDFKFYVLGPPADRDHIFKDGKEGTDVFRKNKKASNGINESALAAIAFNSLASGLPSDIRDKDIPFAEEYVANEKKPSLLSYIASNQERLQPVSSGAAASYKNPAYAWRNIDNDWLSSAGSLALRLTSHINNTSLVLAVEHTPTEHVILLPGDAEFKSWESWHLIEKWLKKGKDKKNLAEDLLNRTIFYKVSHHLSFNGTALQKGINMMESDDLVAMATLDRHRISKGWKSTMPNNSLMEELIRKCKGKLFIMDEFEISKGPSKQLDPGSLPKTVYSSAKLPGTSKVMYKQFNLSFK